MGASVRRSRIVTILAKIRFSHPDMALAHTITVRPEVSLKVLPEAGTDPEHNRYFILVEGGADESFESALDADHTVADAKLVSEYENQRIYGITFADDAKLLSPKVTEMGGISLQAQGTSGGWVERWQFSDRRALNTIWEYARELDFQFDILELNRIDDAEFGDTYGLTDEQLETLRVAFVGGYFDEPRQMSLVDLADSLDISPSAASGRLRRGLTTLLGATVVEPE